MLSIVRHTESTAENGANKTDAGNGSKAICRVSNVLPAPASGALRVVFDKLCHSVPLTLAVA